ncbi:hypothetical protein ACFSS8_05300 [Paracoccus kondratievae]
MINTGVAPDHMMIAPILIPIVAGAIMLFYNDRNRQTKLIMGLVAVGLTFLASIELVSDVKSATEQGVRLSACTGLATGRCRSALCWCSTVFRR